MNQSMRRGEGGRGPRRHESSRPGSRNGSVYDERAYYDPYLREKYERDRMARDYVMRHYAQPYAQPYMAAAAQAPTAASMLPDRAAMDTFEKHWKFYLAQPAAYEQLRTTNPAQFDQLNNYYKMCGEYLRLPPIPAVVKQEPVDTAPTAEANVGGASVSRPDSVLSGQSEDKSKLNQSNQVYYQPQTGIQGAEESAIMPDPNADPRYQPTFVDQNPMNNEDYDKEMENYALTNGVDTAAEPYDASRRITPAKFSSPHAKGVFGALGHFAKIAAKNPLDGQSASVEFHSLAALFEATPNAKELAAFPGPLVPGRTHKGEVIQFCQAKIAAATDAIPDKDSYKLLWELLILLLRQKNAIDGSDIAELLLKDRDVHTPFATEPKADKSVMENGHDTASTSESESLVRHERTVIVKGDDLEKVTMKFRDYLLFGHKKEGLEYAMKHGLWGHALFLASKMDERSYSNVMLR